MRKRYYKMGDADYRTMFDECYAELSAEGKREVDAELAYIIKKCKIGGVKGISEVGAGELLTCLIAQGDL